jgi:hypothetical protein
MTLDPREGSSRCDDERCGRRYFRTVGSSAHCSSVAYDCFHRHFCRAVRNGRLVPKLRKAASASNCASVNAVNGYISVTVCEWLLVPCVRIGVHKRGVRLRDLVGGRWATPIAVMKDIALGAGLWAVWIGSMNAQVLGGGINDAQGILQSLT